MALVIIAENVVLQSKNGPVEINHMSVNTPCYVPDLWIETKKPIPNGEFCNGMDKNHLCRDQVFLDAVIDHLRTLGYEGNGFGRAELGAQGHFDVVMEPDEAFGEFIKKKGWVYAGDLEDESGEVTGENLGVEEAIEVTKQGDFTVIYGRQDGQFSLTAGQESEKGWIIDDQTYDTSDSAYADFKSIKNGEKTVNEIFGYSSPSPKKATVRL